MEETVINIEIYSKVCNDTPIDTIEENVNSYENR